MPTQDEWSLLHAFTLRAARVTANEDQEDQEDQQSKAHRDLTRGDRCHLLK